MPRSRNRADAAESAPAVRSRRRVTIGGASGLMLSAVLLLAAPTRGLGWQAEPGVSSQVATKAADPPPASGPPRAAEVDIPALRAQAEQQLKAINSAAAGATSPTAPGVVRGPGPATAAPSAVAVESTSDKQLREVFQARLRWLEEYDRASKALKKATNPDRSPEQQLADAKEQLGRLQDQLSQAVAKPEVLLPPAYRGIPAGGSPRLSVEMKDALEGATNELKECKSKLDAIRTEVVNWEGLQNTRRAERDKLFQRVASQKAQGGAGGARCRGRRGDAPAHASWPRSGRSTPSGPRGSMPCGSRPSRPSWRWRPS